MHSTTLELKILRTKKRLFNESWLTPIISIALLIVLYIGLMTIQTTQLGWEHGVVSARIPQLIPYGKQQLSISLEVDAQNIAQDSDQYLADSNLAIILTEDSLYFGTLTAFSTRMTDVNNKYRVPHFNGAPQLGKLFSDMKKWSILNGISIPKNVLLIPFSGAPMPVIMEMISLLKKEGGFHEVALGSGIQ